MVMPWMENFLHFILIFFCYISSVQTFVTLTLLCVIECIYIDKVAQVG